MFSEAHAPTLADILVVERKDATRPLLVNLLTRYGYRARGVAGADEAMKAVQAASPDLIILDLDLPGVDGLLFLSDLRLKTEAFLIAFGGSGTPRDRILSLKLGADYYLAKPLDVDEIIARIEALFRRYGTLASRCQSVKIARGTDIQRVGDLEIVHSRRSVTVNAVPVPLTVTEYLLLRALVARQGEVISRKELVPRLWNPSTMNGEHNRERLLDVFVSRLRTKLRRAGPTAAIPKIVTVRSVGYRLLPPQAKSSIA